MRELAELFFLFARIGCVMFGGGYAMLPILERELVDKRHWVTSEEIADYYAIGQCTPGVIAVNTATFIGAKRRGNLGGTVATLGILFPSIVIISVIAAFLSNFASYPVVRNAFAGVRACVCVLILNATIKLFKGALVDVPAFIIFFVVLLLGTFTNLSPVLAVFGAAFCGIALWKGRGKLK